MEKDLINEEEENILIHKEKPYYTEEELRIYYKIAIDEALKQGRSDIAAHYKILLKYLDENKTDKKLFDLIVNKKTPDR